MHQLDNNKIPRINTDGEKHRSVQLIQQLPRQDFSERHSRQLNSEVQRQNHSEFVKIRLSSMDVASVKVLDDTKVGGSDIFLL